MIKRILKVEKVESSPEELQASLEFGGTASEEEIEKELLNVIFKCSPALEENTGRLAPGKKQTEIGLSLFLTEPDNNGISHLAGIRGVKSLVYSALNELGNKGYEVVE